MIQQVQLTLAIPEGLRIPQAWAYRLYGWLMSQLSSEFGDQLHLQGEHPIAHSLYYSQEKKLFDLDRQPAERRSPTGSFSRSGIRKGNPTA